MLELLGLIISSIIGIAAIVVPIYVWQRSQTYPHLVPIEPLPDSQILSGAPDSFQIHMRNVGTSAATNIWGIFSEADNRGGGGGNVQYLLKSQVALQEKETGTILVTNETIETVKRTRIGKYVLFSSLAPHIQFQLVLFYEDDIARKYISIFEYTEYNHWRKVGFVQHARTEIKIPTKVRPAIILPKEEPLLIGSSQIDWGEAPDIQHFYGREQEISDVEQWIKVERVRVIAIVGGGGFGKTSLAIKVIKRVQQEFEIIVWRSLQNAPPLEIILRTSIAFFSHQQHTNLPEDREEQISILLDIFRKNRVLLVLDNIESILQADGYKDGYAAYGKLIRRLGEANHNSCLLLTSREKPGDVSLLDGMKSAVRSLHIAGLRQLEGEEILKDKGIVASKADSEALMQLYSGNPLALKLVSEPILTFFSGNIAEFLKDGEAMIDSIYHLIEQQFHGLSAEEQEILYWLAVEREPVSRDALQQNILRKISKKDMLHTLDLLHRRSMVESTSSSYFTMQPVIMEYMTHSIIEKCYQDILTNSDDFLKKYACVKAQSKEYIRNSQIRVIVSPLAQKLLSALSQDEIELRLKELLAGLRKTSARKVGYTAGNILNILIHLKCDLRNYDFSNLVVWEAYLRNVALPGVNFENADLIRSVFTDAFGSIISVKFSHNGVLLATGTESGETLIWEAASGTLLTTCKGHTDWVRSVAFSSDDQVLASASYDGTIRLWNVHIGSSLKILEGHINRVWSITFSVDSSMLLSGGEDQTIRLWEVSSGRCLRVIEGHTDRVLSVAFSPDGSLLASGSEDQTIRLWEVSSGRCLRVIEGHTNQIWSVAFSPDGTLVVSGSHDQTIRLWKVSTGQCLHVLQGHTNQVWSVAFHPDGSQIASGSHDQTIRFWEVSTGRCLNVLQGYSNPVWSTIFSPDGKLLITGSEDQLVRIWDVENRRCLKTLAGHSSRIWSVAFSPNGSLIASGSHDRTVRLWDTASGRCLRVLQGHDDYVRCVVFSPDGRLLASSSEDQTVYLWEVSTGYCLKVLRGHTGWVRSVIFSPDGKQLASGSEDQTIRIWDTKTGECLHIITEVHSRVRSLSFRPDGVLLAIGSEDRIVRLWDMQTSTFIHELAGHTNWVWPVAFRPDGTLLASGSEDQTILIWEVSTGTCLNVLRGHTSWVWSLNFHPKDQHLLISGSHDGTFKLWDIQQGKCLQTLRCDRPYEQMNITDVVGLNAVQKSMLKRLGAIDTHYTVFDEEIL